MDRSNGSRRDAIQAGAGLVAASVLLAAGGQEADLLGGPPERQER
jgi:hypothetical protein